MVMFMMKLYQFKTLKKAEMSIFCRFSMVFDITWLEA